MTSDINIKLNIYNKKYNELSNKMKYLNFKNTLLNNTHLN